VFYLEGASGDRVCSNSGGPYYLEAGQICSMLPLVHGGEALLLAGTNCGSIYVHVGSAGPGRFVSCARVFDGVPVSRLQAHGGHLFMLSAESSLMLVCSVQTVLDMALPGADSPGPPSVFKYGLPMQRVNDFCVLEGPPLGCAFWPVRENGRGNCAAPEGAAPLMFHVVLAGRGPGIRLVCLHLEAAGVDAITAAARGIAGFASNWVYDRWFPPRGPPRLLLEDAARKGTLSHPGQICFEDPGRSFASILPAAPGDCREAASRARYLVLDREHGRLVLLDTSLGLITCTIKGLRGYDVSPRRGPAASADKGDVCLVAYHAGRRTVERLLVDWRCGGLTVEWRRRVKAAGGLQLVTDGGEVLFCSLAGSRLYPPSNDSAGMVTTYSLDDESLYE